ncbi:MAG: CoA transferase [Syntrophaceae bacterium]|nr:CoA transferase [Syntrophaceae bacterium]
MPKAKTENQGMPGPLDGIRIVEYGVFHAGPGGNAILGDLGAEIIKIETFAGDPERSWTRVAGADFSLKNREGIFFEASNRNKKSICLNIKQRKGREVFNRLIKDADVFLTNLRKSTKAKMRLDYAAISKLNPNIIYASVSAYGTEGPMSDLGAFDPLGQARSGMMYVAGKQEPQLLHLGILDQTTAITMSHAILTALFDRERRGIGQEVHLSLYSAGLWVQYFNILIAGFFSIDPCVLVGDATQHSPLRKQFRCKDGRWIIGTHHPEEKYWATFCKVTGQDALLQDSRYTTAAGGPSNYIELNTIFDKVFASKSADEWMKILLPHGLMFSPIQRIVEIIKDPQALANDFFIPFEHPVQGKTLIPAYPIHFSACIAGIRSAAPKLGEHTDLVMHQIGYTDQEIQELKKEGVIK